MAGQATWVASWARAARLFEMHDAPAYAALASAFAQDPEPGLPESPLVVLAALRLAALQGRATDPHAGDIAAARHDVRRLADEIATAADAGLVQYTDPVRVGDILPGLWLAARWYPGRPLRIVELGASAGMLLLADAITMRFANGAWAPEQSLGAIDYPMEVPPDLMSTSLVMESAVGIDLRPLDMQNPDDVELLHSFTWPGPETRAQRLDLGIRVALARRPRLIQGDVLDLAPDILRDSLDCSAVTVVIDSAFSHYLPGHARVHLGRTFDALCGIGPLVMIARGPSLTRDSGRSAVRAVDLTGRRRCTYAETNFISESPVWLP